MGVAVTAWSVTVYAQPKDLAVPAPEVRTPAKKVALPAVPSFALPAEEPGFVSVQTLRVAGKKRLDTEVKVKGYITWVYDCVTANARRGESRARTQKRIDDDPTLCERRKFYLGDVKNEPEPRSLWVVDVPRPPNKLERERLPKEEIASWPAVPKFKLGDYVVVTGKFARSSPHSERNSDGLVVFRTLEPANKPSRAKAANVAPPVRPTIATPQTKQLIAPPKDGASRERSVKASNAATAAYGLRKYDEAIAGYKQSIAEWHGNHIAHYGLAGSYIGQRDWSKARDAMKTAHELEPYVAMYAMVYAYTLYESAIADARAAQAKKQNVSPEAVDFDASVVNHDKALAHMTYAIQLDPKLWRAHYYIGRIHRDRGEARWAAESLVAALTSGPTDPGPWIALSELYRTWQYIDESIAVTKAGLTFVVGVAAADLWYMLGMGYDEKRKYADSIVAFTKALDANPDNTKALFQRGQAYYRKRELSKAKLDLEAFVGLATTPNLDFPKQQANKMLMDIAANK